MQRSARQLLRPLSCRSFASCATRQSSGLPLTIRQVVEAASKHGHSAIGDTSVSVNGWIKSVRRQKNVAFAQLSDGTDLNGRGLQVVFENPMLADGLTMGTSVKVHGHMVKSPGKGQDFELAAKYIDVLGKCDAEAYPIQKKAHATDFLREHANFRPRTDEIARMLKLRHAAKSAFEDYYDRNEFLNVHTPLITMNDCEGGGEVFRVTTDQPPSPADPASTLDSKNAAFFGNPAFLTVSSQLHLEVFSSAFPRVYTLQPAFRAEGSHTSRHLSEFWMLEAEMAFVDSLEAVMSTLESSIKHVLGDERVQMCLTSERAVDLKRAISSPWKRITYSQAVDGIRSSIGDGSIEWGESISTEQERWLADTIGKGLPVFVTDYPEDMKPFYMRPNPTNGNQRTVACFDLLIPRIGELAGGSMREDRLAQIHEAIRKSGMDPEQYRWYTELRKFGTAPHGGFGLGFERLISWIGGWENIRECIPAPRWKGRCIL